MISAGPDNHTVLDPVSPETAPQAPPPPTTELGGPEGPEPTRFGDWEKNGRCIDF
ncbi:MAG: succinate dehydrogenase assembly factor 4 [Steroidobacteraceae bacterium]